MMNRTILKY